MGDHEPLSVADFCNINKRIQKVTIRSGAVMGRQTHQPDIVPRTIPSHRATGGREYIKKYVEQEEKALFGGWRPDLTEDLSLPGPSRSNICEMEDITSIGSVPNLQDVESDEYLQIYERYNMKPISSKLPIHDKRDVINKMTETNQVLVIVGSTGCGKTTQVPQFILDHHAKQKKRCNIIVTQPRRIAATSVAKRVCEERGWELSTIVGYQIGLDNKTSPDTCLTYCTTGVLREKLVRERNMMAYTHVIIDEVHERDIETDFLMLIVRKLLRSNSRTVKVILMSATIDPTRFAEYFSLPIGETLYPAPVLEVEQNTNFEVQKFYIEQLKTLGTIPNFEFGEPQVHKQAMDIAVRLIMYFDKIDYEEFENEYGRPPTKEDNYKPAVLVFLPGIHEIETMHELLDEKKKDEKYLWHKIPLHSTISREEQSRVFKKAAEGYRKIILSTNIAESSITVPDVVYVIDFCVTKHLTCDPSTNFTSLRYAWAAHSNCDQRAGRAGRIRDGRVYRMVPKDFYQTLLEETEPEMVRCPLTLTVLKTKLLKMGGPKAVLALALDPPDLTRLETTILLLKEAGAMLMTSEGKHTIFDGDITFLGTVMSHLPVDIQLTKLIMLGNVFSILEDAIVMAAWMTVRNVFRNDFHDRIGPYAARISCTGGSSSDCIAYLHAHMMFTEKKRTNYFRTSRDSERGWCKRNFLNYNAMCEANELVDELRSRLKNLGVYEIVKENRLKWDDTFLPLIRKVVIAGAVYPNYFARGSLGGQVDEANAVKTLSGKNPFATVYLQGLPPNQPGELYAKTIKDIIELHAGVVSNVSFDGSSKVFIEFAENINRNLPGKISYPVYRAIKMRQLRVPIDVPMLPVEEALLRMEKFNRTEDKFLSLGKSKPNEHVQDIEFVLAWPNDPNDFWIHLGVADQLQMVQKKLNDPGNLFSLSQVPVLNEIYAAPYPMESPHYYRAQIQAINQGTVKVLFIDYGNVDEISAKLVCELGPNIMDLKSMDKVPPLAVKCTLTSIGPPPLKDNGRWSKQAKTKLFAYLSRGSMQGKVFSEVDGVLSLIVKKQGDEKSLNDLLVEAGLAVQVEESYRSKLDNSNRLSRSSSCYAAPTKGNSYQQLGICGFQHNLDKPALYLDSPSRQECKNNIVRMRGPSSPLEMKVFGCTQVSLGKEIVIGQDSVNSVLLDSNPEDPHERLLVAGHVGTNEYGTKLRLGHTTLMPNMHGLAALIGLIFAPSIELRLSHDKSRYIGALCGLGYDKKTGVSYFPENDMEITFDCLIDLDDLLKVNGLRFNMSKPLETAESQDMCDATPAEILRSQTRVIEILIPLLSRLRPSQEIEVFGKPFQWQQYDPEDLLQPDVPAERSVFPPHYGLRLPMNDE